MGLFMHNGKKAPELVHQAESSRKGRQTTGRCCTLDVRALIFPVLFALSLVFASCGTHSGSGQAGDFSLSATPASFTLSIGGAGQQASVTASATNSFNSPVTLSLSGLPAGVTATPSTLTLTPGTPQSFTLTASSSAKPGSATLTLTGTSGTLSHTTSAALTLTALATTPSFTLSVSPTSLTLVAGAAGSPISVNATPANSFTGTVAVAITGLPSGVTANPATLNLVPGTAQNTTLTAATGTVSSQSTVTFTGTSGSLTSAASLALTVQAGSSGATIPDITAYHDDVARDGLNAQETTLTPANVNSTQFGKIAFDTVDGHVDAQPLYLRGLTAGGSVRNVLYVATEGDSVYAFDADTGAQIWHTSVLATGETTSDDHSCAQISPQIGITSTPVIDRKQGTNGTIFVVAMSKDSSGAYHQRLHALDLTTGAALGTPTEITATYPGTGDGSSGGNVVFAPGDYAERAALLLSNGSIYTAWTSHCDGLPYTGWVMGFSESTLQQTQVLNLTPNGSQGSIWMSGDGLAADSTGNLYFLDANGTFDTTLNASGFPSKADFGNAMIKLSTSGTLAVADYFETYNTVSESSEDKDFGSGGEILLPPQTNAGGTAVQLAVGAGKDGNIYIANTASLGKFTTSSSDSNIYQIVPGALPGGVWGTPAFFNGTLYYGAAYDTLKAFPMANAKLAATPSSQTAITFAFPGTTPSISANGTQNGIVWTLEGNASSAAVLHAYDATNLATELYNSGQAASGRDSFGNGNKFVTPLIVNGKVYVATPTGVAVFGLLPQ